MPTASNFIGDDPTDPPKDCKKCGRKHYRNGRRTCVAHHRDGSGMPCMVYPIAGGTVCMNHGGATPQAQASAAINVEQREIRRKAAAALVTYGDQFVPPPTDLIDPVGELLLLVWRMKMAERFWAERVASLEVPEPEDHIRVMIVGEGDDATPMQVMGGAGAIIGPDRWGQLRTHPFIREWKESILTLAKVSKAAIDAGIDERMTRLAEEQGAMIEALFRTVIESLQSAPGEMLSPWAKERAYEVVGRELRTIGA